MAAIFVVTEHAIDRYLQRIGRASTREEVSDAILANSALALPLKKTTADGGLCYRLPNTPMTLVCRRDPGRTELVVVTILSASQTERQRIPEEELEILREAAIERDEWLKEVAKWGVTEKAAIPVKIGVEAAKAVIDRKAQPPKAKTPVPTRAAMLTEPDEEKRLAFALEKKKIAAENTRIEREAKLEKERLKTERMRIYVEDKSEMYKDAVRVMVRQLVARRDTDPESDALLKALQEKHPWALNPRFLEWRESRDGLNGLMSKLTGVVDADA